MFRRKTRGLGGLFLCFQFLASIYIPVWAAPVPINLDLSSTTASLTAGNLTNTHSVTIHVGSHNLVVTPTTAITPAERLAVYQVASTGQQAINLGNLGNAVGGSFTLGPHFNQYVSSLLIPSGVTAIRDFGTASALNLIGNFTNAGSFFAVSTNQAVNTATISAANISNLQGGLITSVLPSGGLSGITGALNSLNLALNSSQNIVNAGTISSSGSLSMTAAGSITNTANAALQAMNNINLTSQIGSFINNGVIAAQTGNVNFSTGQMICDMVANNTGGTIQALNGAINFRDSTYTGLANLNLTGGDFLSKQLNLYGGNGTVTADIEKITGELNTVAQVAHVNTDTPILTLGDQTISGDPTYANTGAINITGLLTITSGDLAIVSGGNITGTAAGSAIVDNGANVLLIAGANCTSGCGAGGASFTGSNPGGTTGGNITVSLAGGSGGNIDFTASTAARAIDTSNASGAGGGVTLVALANGAVGGQVLFNIGSGVGAIQTVSGSNPGGSVNIFAGAGSGTTAIQTNTINSGSANVGFTVTQATTTGGGGPLTINTSGDISSSNTITNGSTAAGNTVISGNITSAGSVSLTGGTNLTVSSAVTAGSSGILISGVSGTLSNSGTISSSTGNVQFGNMGAVTNNVGGDINSGSGNIVFTNVGAVTNNGFIDTTTGQITSTGSGSMTFSNNPGGTVSAVTINLGNVGTFLNDRLGASIGLVQILPGTGASLTISGITTFTNNGTINTGGGASSVRFMFTGAGAGMDVLNSLTGNIETPAGSSSSLTMNNVAFLTNNGTFKADAGNMMFSASGTGMTVLGTGSYQMLAALGGAAQTTTFNNAGGGALNVGNGGSSTLTFQGSSASDQAIFQSPGAAITVSSTTSVIGSAAGGAAPELDFETTTLTNNGIIHNASAVDAIYAPTTTSPLTINGTGTIGATGDSIYLQGTVINAAQASIAGNVFGSAFASIPGTNFTLTTTSGNINLLGQQVPVIGNGINATIFGLFTTAGGISVTASGGAVNINGSASGNGPFLIAGCTACTSGSAVPSTYSFASYSIYAIPSASSFPIPGAVSLTGQEVFVNGAGGGAANNGPTIASTGADLSITATAASPPGNISMNFNGANSSGGTPTTVLALGGNVLINAPGGLSNFIAGGGGTTSLNVVSIAEYSPGTSTYTIDGVTVPQFTGGNIGISTGATMNDAFFFAPGTGLQFSRTTTGFYNSPVLGGSNTSNTTGGGYFTGANLGTGGVAGALMTGSGTMYFDPPSWSGGTFYSIAPSLTPAPSPPPSAPSSPPPSSPPPPAPPPPPPPNPPAAGSPTPLQTDKTPPQTATVIPVNTNQGILIQTPPQGAQVGWFMSTGSCTMYEFAGLPGTQVQGDVGAVFTVDTKNSIVMADGRILVGAGPAGLKVKLGNTDKEISLQNKAIAIIDSHANRAVRVTVLDGANKGDVATVASAKNELVSLKTGQEAVIADSADNEELIPVDGCQRNYIGGELVRFGARVRKASVAVDKLLPKEPILACCYGLPNNSGQMFCQRSWVSRTLKERYGANEPAISRLPADRKDKWHAIDLSMGINSIGISSMDISSKDDDSATAQDLQPISYVPSAAASAVPKDFHLGKGSKLVPAGPDEYRLVEGSVVVDSRKPVKIATTHGVISTRAGALVLVTAKSSGVTRILDLHDYKYGDVMFTFGKRSYTLKPGGEAILVHSDNLSEARRLVAEDSIGRRQAHIVETDGGFELLTDDFSLVDAMGKLALLTEVRKSGQNRDRLAMSKMIKMAAVLSVTADRWRGQYSVMRMSK